MNGAGNARLFDGSLQEPPGKPAALTPRQASLVAKHRSGPIALDDLAAMIRAYAGND